MTKWSNPMSAHSSYTVVTAAQISDATTGGRNLLTVPTPAAPGYPRVDDAGVVTVTVGPGNGTIDTTSTPNLSFTDGIFQEATA